MAQRIGILILGLLLSLQASSGCLEVVAKADQISLEWHKSIDFKKIEGHLKSSRVVYITPLSDYMVRTTGSSTPFTSEAYLVRLSTGEKALFKVDDALWSAYGEVGAYKLSRYLNLDMVPPTVIRTVKGRQGSLQYWIEPTFRPNGSSQYIKALSKMPLKRRSDLDVFHFLIGQWDRWVGNIVLDSSGNVAAIDNEVFFSRSKARWAGAFFRKWAPASSKAPFKSSETFPFEELEILLNPTLSDLQRTFSGFIPQKKILKLHEKIDKYEGGIIRYVFWNNALWMEVHTKGLGRCDTSMFSEASIDALRSLDGPTLRKILPTVFNENRVADILERRDEILKAAASGEMIP